MELLRDTRDFVVAAATDPRWKSARGLAAVVLLAGLASTVLAACIIEGCTFPPETGKAVEVPLELDGAHPVATSSIEIALSANALPGDVEDRGARLQLTLVDAPDVTLTLVPEGASEPIALIASRGVVSLPLDRCRPDESCTVRALAVVEWTRPQPSTTIAPVLKVEGLVRVPHTKDRCGFSGEVVTVRADPPVPQQAAVGIVGEARHDSTELVRHVTVRYGAGIPVAGATPAGGEGVIARGHLAITPDADPPATGASTNVPGIWLRVTPDDGGPPILDRAIPVVYPALPVDATFPLDPGCARPCERGYWIQAAVYDPAGRRFGDPETAVYGWTFDASVSSREPFDAQDGSVAVEADEANGGEPPTSLVLRGTGEPFRVDASHEATTLVIDATVPARSEPLFGDGIGDATIVFGLTTVGVDPTASGQLWLSNGHYLGDGSTADDEADTGASAGPGEKKSPPGRPFAACVGMTDPCNARTGLVIHRYDDKFDGGAATPPFDVQWTWSVVGAPPGATITVRPVDGETLDTGPGSAPAALIVIVIVVVGGLAALLAVRWLRRRPRAVRPDAPRNPE